MSTAMPLDEAQANLRAIVMQLGEGDDVVIMDGNRVVARIVGEHRSAKSGRPAPGFAKGMITIVEDDDEHLKDFAEYMP